MSLFALILLVGIFVAVPLLTRSKIRAEKHAKGENANTDFHVIEANTSESGHSHTYLIPKDPDEYAKMFIPESHKKRD